MRRVAGFGDDLCRGALCLEPLAWSRWPGERLYTYVAPWMVRSSNPGWCFQVASWRKVPNHVPGGVRAGEAARCLTLLLAAPRRETHRDSRHPRGGGIGNGRTRLPELCRGHRGQGPQPLLLRAAQETSGMARGTSIAGVGHVLLTAAALRVAAPTACEGLDISRTLFSIRRKSPSEWGGYHRRAKGALL